MAASAAHHLVRKRADQLAVRVDGSAVDDAGSVVVKGAVSGDADRAAVHNNVAVGVHAVRVAPAHGDGHLPAVEDDSGRIGGGFPAGIDAVIRGSDVERSAVDLDHRGLQALPGGNVQDAVVDLQDGGGMDAVVAGLDREGAAADKDVSHGIVILVFRVQAVRSGRQAEGAAGDPDGVVRFDGLGGRLDDIGPAGDFQVILADDPVVRGNDIQRGGSAQHQIVPGENDAVRIGASVRPEGSGDRERAVRGRGDEHLVRGNDIDAGEIGIGDGDPVQHQLDFVFVAGFHVYGHAGGGTVQHIGAGLGNPDIGSVADGDGFRVGGVGGLFQIPVREEILITVIGVGSGLLRDGCSGQEAQRQEAGCHDFPKFPESAFHCEHRPFLQVMTALYGRNSNEPKNESSC